MPSISTPWTLTQDRIGQRGEHNVDCASSVPKVQKHRDYFFADGNVLLQVEDVQYKLHRSLLGKHSPVFEALFTIPQPAGSSEGCSEENPIILSGIQAANFTRFLSLLYPHSLGLCDIATVDEWTSVMDQADRWQVDSLREHAIAQLRGLYIEPVRKIIIWQRYNLPADELVPSYMDVISRPQSLSELEAHDLGLPQFVAIAQARDAVHLRGACRCCAGSKPHSGTSAGRDRILEDIVRTVIGITRPPNARY
ncbi:uncharacterized protein TRAVEDRAFT_144265 [Trametes versicolor FP-101664 SS1]|uniref:uncharacterized protein n=1 Tax=Trametes versicolor (strain FP-101664) TaxID=717944 RepID=UPI0004623F0B|nr:uncharacterized protein TRAVEDRAFT_144265 [Trametes versicolor FP-101664 SS1]EIW62001.1 hypothetical protein TRAVEDRAFT_144265 [Trametes versicolor FP-101664 SS1]